MAKLIRTWEELSRVPANDKYRIIVGDCCGWIVPVTDEPMIEDPDDFVCHCGKEMTVQEYFEHHVYLSTHTFYGSQFRRSTAVLQAHGFDVEIDNWDENSEK